MKKLTLTIFSLLCIFCLFQMASFAQAPVKAPDFELQDLRQDIITLGEYTENRQPVLLFFWTTWCPFCRNELRVLNDSYAKLIQDDIEVLSVNVGELPDRVSSFVSDYNLMFRVLLDKDTSVAKSYAIIGVPTYVLVNRDGVIIFKDNFFPFAYKELLEVPVNPQ